MGGPWGGWSTAHWVLCCGFRRRFLWIFIKCLNHTLNMDQFSILGYFFPWSSWKANKEGQNHTVNDMLGWSRVSLGHGLLHRPPIGKVPWCRCLMQEEDPNCSFRNAYHRGTFWLLGYSVLGSLTSSCPTRRQLARPSCCFPWVSNTCPPSQFCPHYIQSCRILAICSLPLDIPHGQVSLMVVLSCNFETALKKALLSISAF